MSPDFFRIGTFIDIYHIYTGKTLIIKWGIVDNMLKTINC